LEAAGVRAEVDLRTESVSKKIRDGEVTKVPYMLVVGDREVEERSVTVRARGSKDTESQPLAGAAAMLAERCSPPVVVPRA
jgi:threonyl-tRNA synthetase